MQSLFTKSSCSTNRSYRHATIARLASPGLLLLLLLLLVLPGPLIADRRFDGSQIGSSGPTEQDCKRVQKIFIDKGFGTRLSFTRPISGSDLGVCTSTTSCCNKQMEQDLIIRSGAEIRKFISKRIHQDRRLITNHRKDFRDEMKKILDVSLETLDSMFAKTYGYIYIAHKKIITDMYDKLREYFDGKNDNIGEYVDQFFPELMKTMLMMMQQGLRNRKAEFNCIVKKLKVKKPFNQVPENFKQILRKTLVTSRTFVMVLSHMGDLQQQISDRVQSTISRECRNALTKLHMCPLCAGSSVKPCPNYCKNVMRGCLYQLYEIAPSWTKLVDKMIGLGTLMSRPAFNIENNLKQLGIKLSDGIMAFQKNYDNKTKSLLMKQCGSRRQPRSVPMPLPRFPNRGRSRSGRSRDGRFRGNFDWSYSQNNQQLVRLIRNILERILRPQKHIWTHFMTSTCKGRSTQCWNGTAEASYDRKVVGNNLKAQVSNPEVVPDISAKDPVFSRAKMLMDLLAKSVERALKEKEVKFIRLSPDRPLPRRILTNITEGSGMTPDLPLRPYNMDTEGSGLPSKPLARSPSGATSVSRPSKQRNANSVGKLPPDDDDRSRQSPSVVEGSGLGPTISSSTRQEPTRKAQPPPTSPPRRVWQQPDIDGSGVYPSGPTQPQLVDRPRPKAELPDESDTGDRPLVEGSGSLIDSSERQPERALPEQQVLRAEIRGEVPNSVWLPKKIDKNGYQVRSENAKNVRPNVASISKGPSLPIVLFSLCGVVWWLLIPTNG